MKEGEMKLGFLPAPFAEPSLLDVVDWAAAAGARPSDELQKSGSTIAYDALQPYCH
jgi:hypothetical protein